MATAKQIERFHRKYDKGDGCWLWKGATFATGYGKVHIDYKHHYAHRLALEFAYDAKIPKGMLVRHLCGVRLCVNPDHLALGTAADNAADAIAHGTFRPFGRPPQGCPQE